MIIIERRLNILVRKNTIFSLRFYIDCNVINCAKEKLLYYQRYRPCAIMRNSSRTMGCFEASPYTKGEERYYKGGCCPLGSLLSGTPWLKTHSPVLRFNRMFKTEIPRPLFDFQHALAKKELRKDGIIIQEARHYLIAAIWIR